MERPESLNNLAKIHTEIDSLLNSYEATCERAEHAESEINDAHTYLSKYIGKEHWNLAGRIDGLIGMIVRARQDGQLFQCLDKIQAEYLKQYDFFTSEEEALKHV